jgi:hypothetical protein
MVPYSSDSNLFVRFYSHFELGVRPHVHGHSQSSKNVLEKAGDAGLWFVEELPYKVMKIAKDPRVVTIALTALALIVDSFLFYPSTTATTLRAVVDLLPRIPAWAVRFSAYILSVETIIAYAARAEGRFMNEHLMKRFYGGHAGAGADAAIPADAASI